MILVSALLSSLAFAGPSFDPDEEALVGLLRPTTAPEETPVSGACSYGASLSADGLHCCPEGYTWREESTQCVLGDLIGPQPGAEGPRAPTAASRSYTVHLGRVHVTGPLEATGIRGMLAERSDDFVPCMKAAWIARGDLNEVLALRFHVAPRGTIDGVFAGKARPAAGEDVVACAIARAERWYLRPPRDGKPAEIEARWRLIGR